MTFEISTLFDYPKLVIQGIYFQIPIFGYLLYKNYPSRYYGVMLLISVVLCVCYFIFSSLHAFEYTKKSKKQKLLSIIDWQKIQREGIAFISRGLIMFLANVTLIWSFVESIVYTIHNRDSIIIILDIIAFSAIILNLVIFLLILKPTINVSSKISKKFWKKKS